VTLVVYSSSGETPIPINLDPLAPSCYIGSSPFPPFPPPLSSGPSSPNLSMRVGLSIPTYFLIFLLGSCLSEQLFHPCDRFTRSISFLLLPSLFLLTYNPLLFPRMMLLLYSRFCPPSQPLFSSNFERERVTVGSSGFSLLFSPFLSSFLSVEPPPHVCVFVRDVFFLGVISRHSGLPILLSQLATFLFPFFPSLFFLLFL